MLLLFSIRVAEWSVVWARTVSAEKQIDLVLLDFS